MDEFVDMNRIRTSVDAQYNEFILTRPLRFITNDTTGSIQNKYLQRLYHTGRKDLKTSYCLELREPRPEHNLPGSGHQIEVFTSESLEEFPDGILGVLFIVSILSRISERWT